MHDWIKRSPRVKQGGGSQTFGAVVVGETVAGAAVSGGSARFKERVGAQQVAGMATEAGGKF